MPSPTRWAARLLTATLAAGALHAAAPAAARPSATPPADRPTTPLATGGRQRTLTLITGDRFLVSADGRSISKLPSPGRDGVPYVTDRGAGRVTVTPVDALPLVDAGKLDPRLFDLAKLLEYGYDDRHDVLPLVITYTGGEAGEQKVRSAAAATAGTVTMELEPVQGLAVRQGKAQLAELWKRLTTRRVGTRARALTGDVARVWLDGKATPSLDASVPRIGAPAAWAAGYDGTGTKVGVVDTGVDIQHPDLKGKVVARDFTGTDLTDVHGHATHVASTMAGTGASDGRYRGVAPGATVYSAKVCVFDAALADVTCDESAIVQAMQWMVAEQVRVINLSLGHADEPGTDLLEEAVQALSTSTGTLFVASTGNAGQAVPRGRVSSPASAPAALAVGSVSKTDVFSPFTNVGPTVGDDALVKPEIMAPGEDIVAARNGGGHQPMSGTSMAAPHVAAAAALLLQQHPDWTAAQLKATLVASARPLTALTVFEQGGGRLDLERAVRQQLTTTPATVALGRHRAVATAAATRRTVTYANSGTAPLTLDLSIGLDGPAGPAPAGMFQLSATRVTVPAGGTASVEVTGNPAAAVRAPGIYSGRLTATSAGTVLLRTAVGLEARPEEYRLTVRHLSRTGQVPQRAAPRIIGLDSAYDNIAEPQPVQQGEVTYLLPKGRYAITSIIQDETDGLFDVTQLVHPHVRLDRDTVVDMDARTAKPLSVTVPQPGAVPVSVRLNVSVKGGGGRETLGLGVGGENFDRVFTGRVGPAGPADAVSSTLFALFAERQADGGTRNSPYTVAVAVREPKTVFHGYARAVRNAELAAVRTTIAEELPKSEGTRAVSPVWPGVERDLHGAATMVDLPARRTEYYTAAGGVTWDAQLSTAEWSNPDDFFPRYVSNHAQEGRRFAAGRTYQEAWNSAVFSPSWPASDGQGITRTGDDLRVLANHHGDAHGRSGGADDSAHLTVARDGVTLAEYDGSGGFVQAPAGPGRFTITVDRKRLGAAQLSTSSRVRWTFTSATTAAQTPLPLSVVRFNPVLDERNTAPASSFLVIPFTTQQQPGSAPARATDVSVEVSFDDGRTWQRPTTARYAGSGFVFVRRPARSGYVSLRAKASDTAGATVEQEIIRAYRH